MYLLNYLIMVIKIINNVPITSLHFPLLIMYSSPSLWIKGLLSQVSGGLFILSVYDGGFVSQLRRAPLKRQ